MNQIKLTPIEAIELVDFDDDNTVQIHCLDIGVGEDNLSRDEVLILLGKADSITLMEDEDECFKGNIEVYIENGEYEYTYIPVKEIPKELLKWFKFTRCEKKEKKTKESDKESDKPLWEAIGKYIQAEEAYEKKIDKNQCLFDCVVDTFKTLIIKELELPTDTDIEITDTSIEISHGKVINHKTFHKLEKEGLTYNVYMDNEVIGYELMLQISLEEYISAKDGN